LCQRALDLAIPWTLARLPQTADITFKNTTPVILTCQVALMVIEIKATSDCVMMVTMAMNLRGLELGSKPAPGDLAFIQGFVNTAELESDRDDLASPEALRDWLVRYGLLEPKAMIGDAEHRTVLEVREAFRALLDHYGQAVNGGVLATLQRVSGQSPLVVVFHGAASALEPAAEGVAGALGRLFAIAYTATVEGTWQRLKVCQNETCRWAFYDHSKNRSGNWCTMAVCGSRLKARAYRQRRAATG